MFNNMLYRRGQAGFTLVELMTVVMVVAILAVIAIPLYNDYTVRTKITEGLGIVATVKTSVSEYFYSSNVLPESNSTVGTSDTLSSPYVANVQVGANGVITISFNAASGVPDGDVIVFVPATTASGVLAWSCNGVGTTVPDHLLPRECR